ncbi:HD domain-containing phosphohydrolase, partial [Desulfosporosinus sp. OT]|uniref:HD-GYP domain-containing protein n=1 Tax=Desulfosporosinus sp. OT TaxID=913865 RepID=UPI00068205E3
MLSTLINIVFPKTNIPEDQKKQFNSELIDTNFIRSRNLSILLLFVMTVLLLTDYLNYNKGLLEGDFGYRLLFYSHLFHVIAILLAFFFGISFNSHKSGGKQRFVTVFSYLTLICSTIVSTADQYMNGQITVFVLVSFLFAILNYQKLIFNMVMYTISYAIFIIGITYAQTNPNILRGHYINGTVLVILAVFLSRILYNAKVKDFISSKTIEHQNNELEKTNQELSIANGNLSESLLALDESQNIIFTLTLTLESKDTNTHGHSERVAKYVMAIAKYLGLDNKDRVNLWRAAILHDIGKIGIPDAILNKPSSLTEDEWSIMKSHPERGAEICSKLKFAREILPIIKYHHEHYDGSGYPEGLKDESIPFLARII